MAIKVDKEKRLFSLETKNTLYQMKADQYGVLLHLWYGKKTGQDMEYLLNYPDVGFSGNIYDADNDRTYSLDTLPQEYSSAGVGDYRVTSGSVSHENGTNALDLRYEEYHILKEKYSIPGLPAVYAGEGEGETLEIVMGDTGSAVKVILRYGVLEDLDIITRSVEFVNNGEEKVVVTKAASFCLDIPYGEWEWVHFHGRHTLERQMERAPLIHGLQESGSGRGTSSHQQNPAVLLCEKNCTETSGECYGAALMYSGGFKAQIELDQMNQVRFVMGIQCENFAWTLEKGESFHTPEGIMTYSSEGMEVLSHRFHKVIREHVCRGEYKMAERPVLLNNWEATYFDFDEKKIYNIAEEAARLGVDMLVLDDGWYGKRNTDSSGLGDWFVNENKIKGGLGSLVEKINDLGMDFGIWLEPEMISEDSDLYREHPEWALQIPERKPMRGRYQLVLDMSRQDVRDYLYEVIGNILKSANISYVKWDFNRSVSDWYGGMLPANRQGELPHRFVLGIYELLERLTTDFPHVLFEGCSGGGGRFDAGMLYYTPQIWCSDDTDAYERVKIQYGTSFFYPVSTVGSHVSTVPNHQTGRITPIESRAVTAMAGSFGYELDLNTLSQDEKEGVTSQIERFKKYRSLIHNGEYYRLSNPMEDKYAIWSYVSEDQSEVLVHGMIFRTEPNMISYLVKLRGLNPDGMYTFEGRAYTGKSLMEGGILLPRSWGDYMPVEMHFTLK